jgi:segregation and condensation protein A
MAGNIKIDVYEGPLDLLLQLIKASELDIYNIPIAEITEQYITYLKSMEELDLEIASEFLVMAATLLEIKSKMLLPKKQALIGEDVVEIDPRQELMERLVEYKKYKEFAERLKGIENTNVIYFKNPEVIDDIEDNEFFFNNISIENLMVAFKKVVDVHERKHNTRGEIPKDINYDEYKIEDKMDEILYELSESQNKTAKFDIFFEISRDVMEVIVIFLAMLELIKLRKIHVYQKNNFGDILIERM